MFIDDSRAQRSVAEDVLHVSSVGDPVAAEDDDRDALTYILEGVDVPSFDIDSESGQLRTEPTSS